MVSADRATGAVKAMTMATTAAIGDLDPNGFMAHPRWLPDSLSPPRHAYWYFWGCNAAMRRVLTRCFKDRIRELPRLIASCRRE
jgi:hypothetical protein